jgi:DNA polymerase-3 subunit beta
MIEMVNNLQGDEVELNLSTPTRAGIFRPVVKAENEELMMLLMPLMIGV